ncbi:Zinc finger, CCHC-type superfamily [Sesbania bispinosa]|nr:Zinc finger, CCHC-type superfamily [Sesbania bispinosa]
MEQTEDKNTGAEDPNRSKSPSYQNLDSDKIPEGYKKISELIDEDIRGLEFDSEEDAYVFYHEYAKFVGFAVRKHDVYRDRNDVITMRQMVCNKEGERSEKHLNRSDRIREAKPLTRTNCKARIRVSLDYKSRKWRVVMFKPTHNHEFTPASMIHLLPAYRGLSVADKAQVDGLHVYGVRTCHIMGLIMGQKGDYSNLGLCKKDLYKHVDKENRAKIEDGDAFAALCYLQAKFDNNPMTFSKNSLVDFLHNFERALNEYRHNELTSYFKSTYTQPVMTTALEKSDVGNVVTMKLNKFGSPDSEYIVKLDNMSIDKIPESLICKRWTKLAKVEHISAVYVEEGGTSKKDLLRSGAIGAACNRLNKAARKNPHNFVKNIECIHKLAEQMERQEGIDLNIADISRVVRDPTVVKTKGAPRKNKKMTKKRKCSFCKRPGHTVRTCTKYATRDQLDTLIEEESSVETYEDSRDKSRSRGVNFSKHMNDITVSGDQNCASYKGNPKKKSKPNEGMKLTQESVNEKRSSDNDTASAFNTKYDFNVNQMNTPSFFGNNVYLPNMISRSMSNPVHIRPSMIHGLGEGFLGNRPEYMQQYPHFFMQQTNHVPPYLIM